MSMKKQERKQLHIVSAILPLPQEKFIQLDPEFWLDLSHERYQFEHH